MIFDSTAAIDRMGKQEGGATWYENVEVILTWQLLPASRGSPATQQEEGAGASRRCPGQVIVPRLSGAVS